MLCYKCQTPIPDTSRFCFSCGADVSGEAATRTQPIEADPELTEKLREDVKGEFVVERELGRGGMAIVFLARDTALGRKVAIKVLPPELTFGQGMVERFKREARTAATLDHHHIIPIYRVAPGGKLFWYAMKYLEGESLEDVLEREHQVPVDRAASILTQTAEALDYAHEHSVVHRDIKPPNIMLDAKGWVTVTDFGIAKALDTSSLTGTNAMIGTPYYMSPEQCTGKKIVTGAADQYSLGVVAFQMLSGHLPFTGDSIIEIVHKHVVEPVPPLETLVPSLPPALVAVVERALAKGPDDRFPTVIEFAAAFARAAHAEGDPRAKTTPVPAIDISGAPPVSTPPSTPRPSTLPRPVIASPPFTQRPVTPQPEATFPEGPAPSVAATPPPSVVPASAAAPPPAAAAVPPLVETPPPVAPPAAAPAPAAPPVEKRIVQAVRERQRARRRRRIAVMSSVAGVVVALGVAAAVFWPRLAGMMGRTPPPAPTDTTARAETVVVAPPAAVADTLADTSAVAVAAESTAAESTAATSPSEARYQLNGAPRRGATIAVDSRTTRRKSFSLRPGVRHIITVTQPGFQPWADTVRLREGETHTGSVHLIPVAPVFVASPDTVARGRDTSRAAPGAATANTGRLSVRSIPVARISVNNQVVAIGLVNNWTVPAGSVRIHLEVTDSVPPFGCDTTVSVGKGQDKRIPAYRCVRR